jgi:hypothetical protein
VARLIALVNNPGMAANDPTQRVCHGGPAARTRGRLSPRLTGAIGAPLCVAPRTMALPKRRRRHVPDRIRHQLVDFYQGDPSAEPQCVLTDEVEHIQIHHLNEQPADSDRVSNLVPLARRLNQAIERRRVRSWPAELTFDRIRDRSGSCYALGRYAQSYGGSMIGLTLAWNVPAACEPARGYSQRPDAAALFCANALVSLRPLNRVDHAATLLALYVVPILRDRGLGVERHTCARLAMEIGSYFRDAGEYSRARRCVAVARRSLSRERNTERNQTLLARLWQHDGITGRDPIWWTD